MDNIRYTNLGAHVPYKEAMTIMGKAVLEVQSLRHNPYAGKLFFLEHTPTITTTRLNKQKHLKLTPQAIHELGIDLIETDRGGDVTFHGPGQLVGYPVLQLPKLFAGKHAYDLLGYLRKLELALLQAVQSLNIKNATLLKDHTGIWITDREAMPRKLIAIGVGCTRGITKHGFALNMTTNLEKYTHCIVPCGLHGMGVTSLEKEFHLQNCEMPSKQIIEKAVIEQLEKCFKIDIIDSSGSVTWPKKLLCHNWVSPSPKVPSLNG